MLILSIVSNGHIKKIHYLMDTMGVIGQWTSKTFDVHCVHGRGQVMIQISIIIFRLSNNTIVTM